MGANICLFYFLAGRPGIWTNITLSSQSSRQCSSHQPSSIVSPLSLPFRVWQPGSSIFFFLICSTWCLQFSLRFFLSQLASTQDCYQSFTPYYNCSVSIPSHSCISNLDGKTLFLIKNAQAIHLGVGDLFMKIRGKEAFPDLWNHPLLCISHEGPLPFGNVRLGAGFSPVVCDLNIISSFWVTEMSSTGMLKSHLP